MLPDKPMPFLILAAIVAASLVWKGYIKLPSRPKQAPETPPIDNAVAAVQVPPTQYPDLSQYPSYELGIAFAKATKREAEHRLAQKFAGSHMEQMMAAFLDPFSPAPPASPQPGQSSAPANP